MRDQSSPPTRGWSGAGAAQGRAVRPLLASAGVFRRPASAGRRPRRHPLRRGWSRGLLHVGRDRQALPSDARVLQRLLRVAGCGGRRPRRHGGAPKVWRLNVVETTFSPPTQRCSGIPAPADLPVRVFPADAGVFRPSRRPAMALVRPPRRRGGVPTSWPMFAASLESSPPARGCSGAPGADDRREPVSPADAGAFRSPPHPPGGGWALPADAGVFRSRRHCAARCCGPPCRRGGVPTSM